MCVSFYGLTIITIWNIRNKDFKSWKKKVFLFLSFYLPGITYEIINPWTLWHFWHYFIFIVPAILIKGRFIYLVFYKVKQDKFRRGIFSFSQCLFIFIYFLFFKKIPEVNLKTSSQIRNGDFYNSEYLKRFLVDVMS